MNSELVNLSGTISTLLIVVFFAGIVIWATSKKRKKDFDEASRLPFDEDELEHKKQ
jgi:cytochrome c oxidase cbb3-type subunit 4